MQDVQEERVERLSLGGSSADILRYDIVSR